MEVKPQQNHQLYELYQVRIGWSKLEEEYDINQTNEEADQVSQTGEEEATNQH